MFSTMDGARVTLWPQETKYLANIHVAILTSLLISISYIFGYINCKTMGSMHCCIWCYV